MYKKILIVLLLLLLLSFNSVVSAEVLINNLDNPIRFHDVISNYSYLPCLSTDIICLHQSVGNAITGQMILIEDNFGSVSSIQIILKRDRWVNDYDNYSTFSLRVYKSTESNPNSAILTLWDTGLFDITHYSSDFALYTFTFDYDMPVYSDDGSTKILNYIWVEMQENDPDVTPVYAFSETHYGIFYDEGENYYPDTAFNDISLYFNQYGTWYKYETIYEDIEKFGDLAFRLLGQFKTPPTPEPTPFIINPDSTEGEIPIPDGCSFEDFWNNLCGDIQGFEDTYVSVNWTVNFSDFTNISNTSCPDCLGNETIDIPDGNLDNDKGFSQFLKLLGYCDESGCSIRDLIDLLYDSAYVMFIISIFYIYKKVKR